MESVDLQMEDIFEVGEADEDLFTSHASVPDLPPEISQEDGTDAAPNIDNDAVLARLRDLSKGAANKTFQRIQPKLDAARLTGDRGIGILPKVLKDVRLKGKGHEPEDLQKVMRYLEHWTHRLFPKMPFDEVLERIEKLGTKREVQTYIKRMRLDIPVENEDNAVLDEATEIFSTSNSESKQFENVSRIGEDEEEVLDELIREEEEWRNQSQINRPSSSCQSIPNALVSSCANTSGGLTASQLERIEANKRRAQERHLTRMGQKPPGSQKLAKGNKALVNSSSPESKTNSLAWSASPQEGDGNDRSALNTDELSSTQQLLSPKADELVGTDQLKSHKAYEVASADQQTEDQILADMEGNAEMDAQAAASPQQIDQIITSSEETYQCRSFLP